jgi:hypothetical protein
MDGYQAQMVVMMPTQNIVIVRLGFTPDTHHGVESLASNILNVVVSNQFSASE